MIAVAEGAGQDLIGREGERDASGNIKFGDIGLYLKAAIKEYFAAADMTISMKALDYLDMPECVYVNHEVELNSQERKLYDQLKKDLIIPLEDGDIDAANAASLSINFCR